MKATHNPYTDDSNNTIPVLPTFCIENYYPYAVHVHMFCEYNSLYESALGLVRKLCSGFQEHELTQNSGFINETDIRTSDILSTRNKIDAEMVLEITVFFVDNGGLQSRGYFG